MGEEKRTVKYRCGQCGSKSLYRDEDRINGNRWIACLICGNRRPGGYEPALIEEEDMAKKGICTNCKRGPMNIVNGQGHCNTCHNAQNGKEGAEKEAALREAAERLKGNPVGRWGERRKIAPPGLCVTGDTERLMKEIEETAARILDLPGGGDDEEGAAPGQTAKTHTPALVLQINTDLDREILRYLELEAERNRRTVEQQALWILECRLPGPLKTEEEMAG